MLREQLDARIDLSGADLGGADLRGAHLWGVNLRGVNLWAVNLTGVNLRGADLEYIQGWKEILDFTETDISAVKGLSKEQIYFALRHGAKNTP